MSKPAPLTAGLLARKGEAAPIAAPPPTEPPTQSKGEGAYFRSLTLKLDKPRYAALRMAAAAQDRTHQDILTEALDAWLAKRGQ